VEETSKKESSKKEIERFIAELVKYDTTLVGWRELTLADLAAKNAAKAAAAAEASVAPAASASAAASASVASVASVSSEEIEEIKKIKNALGEELYLLIHAVQPELASKITGMILELDNTEIRSIIESPDKLKEKIAEALDVLALQVPQQSSPSTPEAESMPSTDLAQPTDLAQLEVDFDRLLNDYEKIKEAFTPQLNIIQSKHQALHTEHESLQTKHESLQTEHESLQTKHESLQTENQALLTENQALRDQLRANLEMLRTLQQTLPGV